MKDKKNQPIEVNSIKSSLFSFEEPSWEKKYRCSVAKDYSDFIKIKVQSSLYVQHITSEFLKTLVFLSIPKTINNLFVLDFLQNKVVLSQEFRKVCYDNKTAVISAIMLKRISASKQFSKYNFSICFSRRWMEENVFTDYLKFSENFENKEGINVAIKDDFTLCKLIKEVDIYNSKKLDFNASIFKLMGCFFENLNNRKNKHEQITKNVHSRDRNKLIKVGQIMDNYPETRVQVKDLADYSAMSLSKFKRLFSCHFGTTPYQYLLRNKMEKSMKLLKSGKCTVSEAGYKMGYTNLSQFSKAFKKHFGHLPSEVKINF
ncbi:helix-turn-helix domain-containing protein [Tenacibaculum sp. UWU-22]|uniref:helix-turn-helix domain-containing protein n=1 Tax=Tenacibaculum sp. UWU-22 TaxID=3234187 RepID=UPI0034DB60A2